MSARRKHDAPVEPMPGVKEILIVQSTRIEAFLLRRQADGAWPEEHQVIGHADRLELSSIDFSMPLPAAYSGTYLAQ